GLLLLGGPGVEFFLGDDAHHDGHEGVVLAAQLGALAAIGAGFGSAEPGVAQEAGDGVLLDAEVGHHPGVNDVGRRDDDAHFLVDGNDELVVDFHQVGVAARLGARDLRAGRGQRGEELDVFGGAVKVLVAPFPLVAGGLDGDVRAGGVLHGDHGARGGQGHGDDDEKRDDGPGYFDAHVLVELGRLSAAGLAVHQDRIEHDTEDADENDRTDDEHHPVQPHDVVGNLGYPWREIELVDPWSPGHIFDLCTGRACHEHCACSQYPSQLLHADLEIRSAFAEWRVESRRDPDALWKRHNDWMAGFSAAGPQDCLLNLIA